MRNASSTGEVRVTFLCANDEPTTRRFVRELAGATAQFAALDAVFVVRAGSEIAEQLDALDVRVLRLPAASNLISAGASLLTARRIILDHLKNFPPNAAIGLVPDTSTALLARAIQRRTPYLTVVHDVFQRGHQTGRLNTWLRHEARSADLVVTLSRTVADRVAVLGIAPPDRIMTLFCPDLCYGSALANRERDPRAPLKLLFFGHISKYKGLSLLIEAVERLRADGIPVHLGVAGPGNLQEERPRMLALGAEILNRTIKDDEVGPLLARYDALALSHLEGSQSAAAAAALGNLMPVVSVPTPGLTEQIVDGRTGILAHRVSARSLADAIHRLAVDPELYNRIAAHLSATAEERSMSRFLDELLAEALELKWRKFTVWDPEPRSELVIRDGAIEEVIL